MRKLVAVLVIVAAISIVVVGAIEANVMHYFVSPPNIGKNPGPNPSPNPSPNPNPNATEVFVPRPGVNAGGTGGGYQGGFPNFVVILTDDQRWDTLWSMPVVEDQLVKNGVTFNNTFVTTPLCCPSRSSILSGGFYPFSTGVISNDPPNGGAPKFQDSNTLATMLQEKGYKTGLVGKYLNAYAGLAPYVPPGWSTFVTTFGPDWNSYQTVTGSTNYDKSGIGQQSRQTEYNTYYLRDKGLQFIDENANSPFFLLMSFNAPHKPATPAPEDKNLFSNYVYQSPGTQEKDLSDKPPSVRDQSNKFSGDEEEAGSGALFTKDASTATEYIRDQLRTLQPVDRSVDAILKKLEEKGILDKTVVIFTSDNGYMWGEHGLFFKAKPYEESLRVPLVIRMPGVATKQVNDLVAMNLDLPTTVLDLAGINTKTDGLSLYPLMNSSQTDNSSNWRNYLVFQSFGEHKNVNGWSALRTQDWKLIQRPNGETELYNLANDPYELQNLYNDTSKNDPAIKEKANTFSALMKPLTAVTISTFDLPKAQLNIPYKVSLSATGGMEPYAWSVYSKSLPSGLELSKNGVISGIPKSNMGFGQEFEIMVTDSSDHTQSGKPQSYISRFVIQLG